MLGPVRMMKGACLPPSSTSFGTKVVSGFRCSPAERCLRPFALNTCMTIFQRGQDTTFSRCFQIRGVRQASERDSPHTTACCRVALFVMQTSSRGYICV